tara:strand:+ start:61 stop:429 length:369 start_codon:yes stop_codon:yes gene_type:complete
MAYILISTWIFVWFVLYYLNLTKYNPSIAYVFLIIPILYLYVNTLLYRKNDIDKPYVILMFTIIDVLPLPLLLLNNKFELQFESFILFLVMIFSYLVYIVKYRKIDINELYKYYLFDYKIFN